MMRTVSRVRSLSRAMRRGWAPSSTWWCAQKYQSAISLMKAMVDDADRDGLAMPEKHESRHGQRLVDRANECVKEMARTVGERLAVKGFKGREDGFALVGAVAHGGIQRVSWRSLRRISAASCFSVERWSRQGLHERLGEKGQGLNSAQGVYRVRRGARISSDSGCRVTCGGAGR